MLNLRYRARMGRAPADPEQPGGTVTLLFTDIEGSTLLLQALGAGYADLLAAHHRLLREIFEAQGGTELGSAGDGLYFSFPSARAALAGAVAAQRAIAAHEWPPGASVRVRMGLHTGEPRAAETGYVGVDVHIAARIGAAGHGGQILISQTTRDLVASDVGPGVSTQDLGEHRLKDLFAAQRIFQVSVEGLPATFPALRTLDARPNNLPRELTTFVGRDDELLDAKRLLMSARLLTLTGPGGVGKTRLAVELAARLIADFDDGVWLVELGDLSDGAFVPQAIATTLNVREQAGRDLLTELTDHLAHRQLLLILDNCEHLVAEAARAANAILRRCPGVRIVATSREGLGVPGEAIFAVPSLGVPAAAGRRSRRTANHEPLTRYDAVRLFAERAAAIQPSFELTSANTEAVVRICRCLDGVPLALELAAARVRALSVEQIATRLDSSFRLLAGGSRVAVSRHQTLQAAMDWSYELLSDEERAVLRRLAVFAGDFELEAAEAVCRGDTVAGDEVLDLLVRLVDKSLVVADVSGSEVDYRLLGTIRQYARERLEEAGEAEEAGQRHRDWYLKLVEAAKFEFFQGPESTAWLERLEHEHDNLRAALDFSAQEAAGSDAGLRLAAALWRFWEMRGYLEEGRAWLERMLASTAAAPSALRANALTGAGVLASMQGDLPAANAFNEESLALHRQLGNPNSIAYALNNLANIAVQQGDYGRARALYEEGNELTRSVGDVRGLAFGLTNTADVEARLGDTAAARAHFDEAVRTFQAHGDLWGMAFALDSFGLVERASGDLPEARSLHEQALAISRRLGDERGVARTLGHLGDLAAERGDRGEAVQLLLDSAAIRQRLGDLPGLATALERLAWVAEDSDAEDAARLLGAAEALRESIGVPLPPASREDHARRLAAISDVMGAVAFEAARRDGRVMALEEVLAGVVQVDVPPTTSGSTGKR
jgi:predicted ATPase/class 3 adenylate cyclase